MVHLDSEKSKITILNCIPTQHLIMQEHIQFLKPMSKPYDTKSIGYAKLES